MFRGRGRTDDFVQVGERPFQSVGQPRRGTVGRVLYDGACSLHKHLELCLQIAVVSDPSLAKMLRDKVLALVPRIQASALLAGPGHAAQR